MIIAVITDWHTHWRPREDSLPDVAPGVEFETVVRLQKFIVLHRIRVVNLLPHEDMVLTRLEIGEVKDVPFELESERRYVSEGPVRAYQLKDLTNDDLKERLITIGADVATKDSIAIGPTLDVRAVLRNDGMASAKPRDALLVQEETA